MHLATTSFFKGDYDLTQQHSKQAKKRLGNKPTWDSHSGVDLAEGLSGKDLVVKTVCVVQGLVRNWTSIVGLARHLQLKHSLLVTVESRGIAHGFFRWKRVTILGVYCMDFCFCECMHG